VARLYANENFPFPVVEELRRLSYDALTVLALSLFTAAGACTAQVIEAMPLDARRQPPVKHSDRSDPGSQNQPRTDLYGDPLPPGALARLGSVQLRHQGLTDLVFLPDNRTLVSSGWNREIRLWDASTGNLVRTTQLQGTAGPGRGLALSPDGKTVACWDSGKLYFWNAATGKEIKNIPCPRTEDSFNCNFSPDGRILTVGTSATKLVLCDWRNEKQLEINLPAKFDSIDSTYHTCFSSDGKLIATGAGMHQPLCIWEVDTGKEVRRIDDQATISAFSPDGKLLGVASMVDDLRKGTVFRLREVTTGKQVLQVPLVGKKLFWWIDFSPDGNTIALSDPENTYLLDRHTGQEIRRLPGSGRMVFFSKDGRLLAGNDLNRIRLWEVTTGKELHNRPGSGSPAQIMVQASDGSLIATAGERTAIELWDPATGRQVRHVDLPELKGEGRTALGEQRSIRSLAFSADGRTVIAGLSDGLLQYLDGATGKVVRTVPLNDPNQPKVQFAAFLDFHLSPDGRHVSTLGRAFTREFAFELRLWETDSGKLVRRGVFSAHQPRISKPLGMKWAVRLVDGMAIVDGISGQTHVRLPGTWIPPLAASPDNRLLAGRFSQNPRQRQQPDPNGEAKAIRVCETATGEEVLTLVTGSVDFLALGADNRTLVTADTAYLRLWDLATRQELHRRGFPKEFAVSSNVKFLEGLYLFSDGHRATTALADGTLLVWDLTLPSRRAGLVVNPPDPKELERLWSALADKNASKAYAAIWKLADMPEQAAVFFRKNLKPAVAEDPKKVAELIANLDNDVFAVRETATEELKKIGGPVAPALREALATKPSLEVRRRLDAILTAISTSVPTGEVLRHLRAIQVLEQIGSREARAVLGGLATGTPEALETQEAKASLDRMGK